MYCATLDTATDSKLVVSYGCIQSLILKTFFAAWIDWKLHCKELSEEMSLILSVALVIASKCPA